MFPVQKSTYNTTYVTCLFNRCRSHNPQPQEKIFPSFAKPTALSPIHDQRKKHRHLTDLYTAKLTIN